MKTWRLLYAFVKVPLLQLEISGVYGGCLFRPASAMQPSGVAALSFDDETRGQTFTARAVEGQEARRGNGHVEAMGIDAS